MVPLKRLLEKFNLNVFWQNSTFHTDTLFIWTSSFGLMTLSQEKLLMCRVFPLNGTISDEVLVSFHSIKQLESNLCFFFASGHFPILVDWQLCPVPLKNSLHWIISLSFCSFSYNGVCCKRFELSVSDVIVSQQGYNGDGKLNFFGLDYNLTCSLCTLIHLWAKIYLQRLKILLKMIVDWDIDRTCD